VIDRLSHRAPPPLRRLLARFSGPGPLCAVAASPHPRCLGRFRGPGAHCAAAASRPFWLPRAAPAPPPHLGLVGYVAPLPGTSLLEVPSSSAGSALVGRLAAPPHASWSKGPSSPFFCEYRALLLQRAADPSVIFAFVPIACAFFIAVTT
jgi:hypothetical protein